MADAPKILVVEDNPDILENLVVILQLRGFRVETLTHGDEVMDHVGQSRPDLILLDVMIPRPDGYQVCQELKSNSSTRAIPVVLISAKSQKIDVHTGYRMGADRYITKPYNNADLLKTIQDLLDRPAT